MYWPLGRGVNKKVSVHTKVYETIRESNKTKQILFESNAFITAVDVGCATSPLLSAAVSWADVPLSRFIAVLPPS